MEQNETLQKLLPPRAIDSLTTGVSAIEKRPYVLLLPVLYDLFLWLGPRLGIEHPVNRIFAQLVINVQQIYEYANVSVQPLYDLQVDLLNYLKGYNLFSVINTFPIGIPSLLSNMDTSVNPLGSTIVYPLNTIGAILMAVVGLAFLGVLLGSAYLHILAPKGKTNAKNHIVKQVINSLIYSILLFIVIAVGIFSALFISSFFTIIIPELGQFVFMMLTMLIVMLLLPAFYAFVPIFMYGQSFYQAVVTSYQVVGLRMRYTINENTIIISPKIVTFSMIIVVVYQGLNLVWTIPSVDKWVLIVGILGHSLICSVILLASFDFFEKMCDWHRRISGNEFCQ